MGGASVNGVDLRSFDCPIRCIRSGRVCPCTRVFVIFVGLSVVLYRRCQANRVQRWSGALHDIGPSVVGNAVEVHVCRYMDACVSM